MSFSEVISPLLGRFLLAWFFLGDAVRFARGWTGTVAQLNAKEVPAPEIILFFMILFMALGGIALLLGFRTKLGALFLFAILILWTITMNDYWAVRSLASRQAEYDTFARNLAIAGGLLLLLGLGGGPFSMDNVQSGGGKGKGRR
jgi:putative oxidoreductase